MGAIRWVIIRVAEVMALLVIVYGIYAGVNWGPSTLPELIRLLGIEKEISLSPQVAMAIGGVIGFLISALITGLFFLLVEIERHSRRTAYYFERLAGRGQGQPD